MLIKKITTLSFRRLCITTLSLGLFVILWGAWLRFSFSGDGCGTDWPLCNDQLIPNMTSSEAWMEWIHRVSSSIFGLFIIAITFYAFRIFPKTHKARLWASLSLLFTISEALIGAFLVMSSLTGHNDSLLRPVVLAAHLVNSLLLVASLVMCFRHTFSVHIPNKKVALWCLIFLLLAITGSIASLSNTLFPSTSLLDGLKLDFNPESPIFLKLRILHPILSIFLGGGVFYYLLQSCIKKIKQYKLTWKLILKEVFSISLERTSSKLSIELTLFFMISLGLLTGLSTLLTLSPIAMKLIHLGIFYGIWVTLLSLK